MPLSGTDAAQLPRRVMVAVVAAHAVIGFAVARATSGPLLSADDIAYLGMGKALTGAADLPLPAQPPYGLAYPALLSPGWLLGLDGDAMITWARLVNAGLGAALIPLLYLLVRRLTDAPWPLALAAATATASLPAALAHGTIVWTENLMPLVVVAGLVALVALVDRPSAGPAVVVAVLAVAQIATHPRGALAAAVLVTAGVWVTVRARELVATGWLLAAAAAGTALVEWLRQVVQDRAFDSTGTYDVGDLAERRGIDLLDEMAVLGAGTIAYLVLASAGLAVIGALPSWRSGVVGRTALAVVGATVVVAGWFLTGVPRADKWLHGRYVEAVAAPLIAVGLVQLARMTPRALAALAGLLGVAGAYAAWAGPGANWSRPRSPVMMLGVEPSGAPFGADHFRPALSVVVTAVVVLAWWLVARHRPRWLPVALAVVLAAGVASNLETLDQLYAPSVAAETDAATAGVESVTIDPAVPAPVWLAVAWRVGLDDTVVSVDAPTTSHHLVPTDAVVEPPPGSVELPGSLLVPVG